MPSSCHAESRPAAPGRQPHRPPARVRAHRVPGCRRRWPCRRGWRCRRGVRTRLPCGSMPSATPRQDWRVLLAIFWLTSMVEGLGVSQIFAFLPSYLREMGVAEPDRLQFVGLFGALIFVVGMPLVPLWGVWADKYSRKVVIIRSALVEAAVFACVALSREPWQLAGSMLLIGFQLGNTGVMLAGIRDVTPRARLGTTIAVFGASGPIGFAVGPVLAGILHDGIGWSLPAVFASSAVLSIG